MNLILEGTAYKHLTFVFEISFPDILTHFAPTREVGLTRLRHIEKWSDLFAVLYSNNILRKIRKGISRQQRSREWICGYASIRAEIYIENFICEPRRCPGAPHSTTSNSCRVSKRKALSICRLWKRKSNMVAGVGSTLRVSVVSAISKLDSGRVCLPRSVFQRATHAQYNIILRLGFTVGWNFERVN